MFKIGKGYLLVLKDLFVGEEAVLTFGFLDKLEPSKSWGKIQFPGGYYIEPLSSADLAAGWLL